jgi:V/A-type H+-transporting ATPase subunit D
VASRAVELLERKQQVLRRECRRLAELVTHTEREWGERAAEADRANVRALVSGGRDELRRAESTVAPANVRVLWTTAAGATFPSVDHVDVPPPSALAATPALLDAAAAGRRALDAAARHAAATRSLHQVESELTVTVRRLRAIRRRWIPQLEAQLAQLERRLDDGDREEVTRLRWAGLPATSGHQE